MNITSHMLRGVTYMQKLTLSDLNMKSFFSDKNTDRGADGEVFSSYLLLSNLELSDTHSQWVLNTSPPRNRCMFM